MDDRLGCSKFDLYPTKCDKTKFCFYDDMTNLCIHNKNKEHFTSYLELPKVVQDSIDAKSHGTSREFRKYNVLELEKVLLRSRESALKGDRENVMMFLGPHVGADKYAKLLNIDISEEKRDILNSITNEDIWNEEKLEEALNRARDFAIKGDSNKVKTFLGPHAGADKYARALNIDISELKRDILDSIPNENAWNKEKMEERLEWSRDFAYEGDRDKVKTFLGPHAGAEMYARLLNIDISEEKTKIMNSITNEDIWNERKLEQALEWSRDFALDGDIDKLKLFLGPHNGADKFAKFLNEDISEEKKEIWHIYEEIYGKPKDYISI